MATKYTRESEVGNGQTPRRTPWMRQGPPLPALSQKQWLFIAAAALVSIILLVQIAVRMSASSSGATRPVHRGVGTIVERGAHTPGTEDAPGKGAVTIEIALEDGRRASAAWTIPDPYWRELEVGSRIAVLYQVDPEADDIRIIETGVVALDGDIR